MTEQTILTANGATAWKSARLIYRAVEDEDDAFLQTFNADPESFLNSTNSLAVPRGKKAAAEVRQRLQEDSLLGVIVCLPPAPLSQNQDPSSPTTATDLASENDPIPIGTLSLRGSGKQDRSQHRRATIGISLLRRFQGRGYGSEAIQWVLRWGFRFANLHSLEIATLGYNPGALRLYERLGFVLEGRRREACWFDGRYWDAFELAMLDREWREKYDGLETGVPKALASDGHAI